MALSDRCLEPPPERLIAHNLLMNLVAQLNNIYSKATQKDYSIVSDISGLANKIINGLDNDADMLIGLVHLRTDLNNYALTRTIQNTIFAVLTAKRLNWEGGRIHTLACACLTQNIGMFPLQNDLAEKEKSELTEFHYQQIRLHPIKGAKMLASMGVKDQKWLSAVAL